MRRVFLDANVLFSAGYDPTCRIARLWDTKDVELVASDFVAIEATRNMKAKHPAGLVRLAGLLKRCRVVDDPETQPLPDGLELAEKDHPVLRAAVACRANYLLSGDKHFRSLYGRVIMGVTILRPGDFLAMAETER